MAISFKSMDFPVIKELSNEQNGPLNVLDSLCQAFM
jgi:hypothetical protein